MTPIDRIRFHLIEARRLGDHAALPDLLSQAMLTERKAMGAATRDRLVSRYGFTPSEIEAHASAALDRATLHWARTCAPRNAEPCQATG